MIYYMLTRTCILTAFVATCAAAANDYSQPETWLCRPGRSADVCGSADLSTTVVSAQGKLKVEKWTGNANAPVDCFYVYPTVSLDTTPNSDMIPGPEEVNVVLNQFARFGSQCRIERASMSWL